MKHFIIKTEPSEYSIHDLAREDVAPWDGVYNYQAMNHIKTWQPGDVVYLYHSGQKCIVGKAEVVSEPMKDTSSERESWVANIKHRETFPKEQQISLTTIKQEPIMQDSRLVRQARLSVIPCTAEHVAWIESQIR